MPVPVEDKRQGDRSRPVRTGLVARHPAFLAGARVRTVIIWTGGETELKPGRIAEPLVGSSAVSLGDTAPSLTATPLAALTADRAATFVVTTFAESFVEAGAGNFAEALAVMSVVVKRTDDPRGHGADEPGSCPAGKSAPGTATLQKVTPARQAPSGGFPGVGCVGVPLKAAPPTRCLANRAKPRR